MKKAEVFVNNIKAAELIEIEIHNNYELTYDPDYQGHPISLTLPVQKKHFKFKSFPAVFEGLLPEGAQLEALLRDKKINRSDLFKQLMACGSDCVGAISVKEIL